MAEGIKQSRDGGAEGRAGRPALRSKAVRRGPGRPRTDDTVIDDAVQGMHEKGTKPREIRDALADRMPGLTVEEVRKIIEKIQKRKQRDRSTRRTNPR